MLFPASLAGIALLGALDLGSAGWSHWSRLAVGGALALAGGALASWGHFGPGIRASQGLDGPLLVTGAYPFSRNPQYVGTVGLLLGDALLRDSALALIASALGSSWYLLAPFAEESWLRERLGDGYEEYAAQVRRYL